MVVGPLKRSYLLSHGRANLVDVPGSGDIVASLGRSRSNSGLASVACTKPNPGYARFFRSRFLNATRVNIASFDTVDGVPRQDSARECSNVSAHMCSLPPHWIKAGALRVTPYAISACPIASDNARLPEVITANGAWLHSKSSVRKDVWVRVPPLVLLIWYRLTTSLTCLKRAAVTKAVAYKWRNSARSNRNASPETV